MEAELPAMFQNLIPVAQYVLMVAVGFLLLLGVLFPVTLFCAVLCTYLPGLVHQHTCSHEYQASIRPNQRQLQHRSRSELSRASVEPTAPLNLTC